MQVWSREAAVRCSIYPASLQQSSIVDIRSLITMKSPDYTHQVRTNFMGAGRVI